MAVRARGRRARTPGEMTKLEADYAQTLNLQRLAGTIQTWYFEKIKLRLAPATFYTPDFLVIQADGLCQFHEVKGFWEDDARVKIKVAAAQFPEFKFIAITRNKITGAWQAEEFK